MEAREAIARDLAAATSTARTLSLAASGSHAAAARLAVEAAEEERLREELLSARMDSRRLRAELAEREGAMRTYQQTVNREVTVLEERLEGFHAERTREVLRHARALRQLQVPTTPCFSTLGSGQFAPTSRLAFSSSSRGGGRRGLGYGSGSRGEGGWSAGRSSRSAPASPSLSRVLSPRYRPAHDEGEGEGGEEGDGELGVELDGDEGDLATDSAIDSEAGEEEEGETGREGGFEGGRGEGREGSFGGGRSASDRSPGLPDLALVHAGLAAQLARSRTSPSRTVRLPSPRTPSAQEAGRLGWEVGGGDAGGERGSTDPALGRLQALAGALGGAEARKRKQTLSQQTLDRQTLGQTLQHSLSNSARALRATPRRLAPALSTSAPVDLFGGYADDGDGEGTHGGFGGDAQLGSEDGGYVDGGYGVAHPYASATAARGVRAGGRRGVDGGVDGGAHGAPDGGEDGAGDLQLGGAYAVLRETFAATVGGSSGRGGGSTRRQLLADSPGLFRRSPGPGSGRESGRAPGLFANSPGLPGSAPALFAALGPRVRQSSGVSGESGRGAGVRRAPAPSGRMSLSNSRRRSTDPHSTPTRVRTHAALAGARTTSVDGSGGGVASRRGHLLRNDSLGSAGAIGRPRSPAEARLLAARRSAELRQHASALRELGSRAASPGERGRSPGGESGRSASPVSSRAFRSPHAHIFENGGYKNGYAVGYVYRPAYTAGGRVALPSQQVDLLYGVPSAPSAAARALSRRRAIEAMRAHVDLLLPRPPMAGRLGGHGSYESYGGYGADLSPCSRSPQARALSPSRAHSRSGSPRLDFQSGVGAFDRASLLKAELDVRVGGAVGGAISPQRWRPTGPVTF
ncbi:hypothetical protein T492DRAFT_1005345 [Pavlovales sp. CCMP2436]|nr:hypothetical protein T492DRAFT_1005345 [Pavlovales sp. CCMP2436]